jgi:hypothetical protein
MRNVLGALLLLTLTASASGLWSTSRVEVLGVEVSSADVPQKEAIVRYKVVFADGAVRECQSSIGILAASEAGVTLHPEGERCHNV